MDSPLRVTPEPIHIADPAVLELLPHLGTMQGRNTRYEKSLAEVDGLYLDAAAFDAALADDDGEPVYWVESSILEEGPGALTVGISVLEPGCIGSEFYMTRGHLHARPECAEVYYALVGHGVMLIETFDGRSATVELRAGQAVHIPGHSVHRSVNVGSDRFATLFCYPTEAGQDYDVIRRAGGMKQMVIADGDSWTSCPNPRHRGYRV